MRTAHFTVRYLLQLFFESSVAAGLPLTWTSGQKAEFKAYLSKNAEVEFVYKKTAYHIYIDDVRIYPQGLCVPKSQSKSAPRGGFTLWGLTAHNPPERRDDIMGKDIRIDVRVTAKEKEKIQSKARKCRLSTTEYVKQRALGYKP